MLVYSIFVGNLQVIAVSNIEEKLRFKKTLRFKKQFNQTILG